MTDGKNDTVLTVRVDSTALRNKTSHNEIQGLIKLKAKMTDFRQG